MRDALGNAVALGEPSSLAGVDAFVDGFLACEARVVDVLPAAARDDAPIVQACAAAPHLFAEAPGAAEAARRHLARADASRVPASPRERRFVEAVRAWADDDLGRAIALHEEQARENPRDLASVKLGQYHCFSLGDSPRMLRLALAAAPAAGDVAPMHGMLAFGFEQCRLLRRAEAAARCAVAMRRRGPWAHHALAHVMLTEGRFDEGEAFLRSVADAWTGLNSFMVTHNWWHLALFLIEQDRLDEALAMHDARVWGVCRDYSQDQVNAVSLLARLALAGRPEADAMFAAIEAFAPRAPAAGREAWVRVTMPAARGLLAHARGDAEGALAGLGEALPRMVEIGGSHAQRDLFKQMHVDALMAAGRWAAVQHALQPAASARPRSRRLAARLRRTYRALGLAGATDA